MSDLFPEAKGARPGLTTVVNIRQTYDFDAYVGRAGHGWDGTFGNPFTRENHGSDAVRLFRDYFLARVEQDSEFRAKVLGLAGKRLGCFCVPDHPCHAEVIADFLNNLLKAGAWD